jgi:hypothetical protein
MKRSTKILGGSTGLLAAAAFAGLIGGASSHATAAATTGITHATSVKTVIDGKAGVKARAMDGTTSTHDCKGKNDCKGQGGCKTGDQGCKGKNSCKGNGGCKTNGSALMF